MKNRFDADPPHGEAASADNAATRSLRGAGAAFYDVLETRLPGEREAALLSALPAQVAHAQGRSAAFAQILQGVDAASITTRAALALLPVTRKHELQALQQASRQVPGGGGSAARICKSRFHFQEQSILQQTTQRRRWLVNLTRALSGPPGAT